MDSKLIFEAARGTLDGTLSFPEVVGKLLAAGVEYFMRSGVSAERRHHKKGAERFAAVCRRAATLPPVAPEFDAAALRANILDSQRHNQPYREFTRRAMAAGVQGYIAFLRGKRVTYWGRTGDQHTEWFPGTGPNPCRTGHLGRPVLADGHQMPSFSVFIKPLLEPEDLGLQYKQHTLCPPVAPPSSRRRCN